MKAEDKNKWLELVNRYFEAETTDEEEKRLMRFLASDEACDKEFDEARATIGFLQVGRTIHEKRGQLSPRRLAWTAVAAGLALLLSMGVKSLLSTEGECYAYVDGVKITDSEQVVAQMRQSMKTFSDVDDSANIENQLKDMFRTMNEFEK